MSESLFPIEIVSATRDLKIAALLTFPYTWITGFKQGGLSGIRTLVPRMGSQRFIHYAFESRVTIQIPRLFVFFSDLSSQLFLPKNRRKKRKFRKSGRTFERAHRKTSTDTPAGCCSYLCLCLQIEVAEFDPVMLNLTDMCVGGSSGQNAVSVQKWWEVYTFIVTSVLMVRIVQYGILPLNFL